MPSIEKYLLSLIVLAPAAGALLLIFVPSRQKNAVRAVATVASLTVLLLSLSIAFAYDRAMAGFQFTEEYPWLSLLGVTFKLAVDGISVPLLLLTGIVLFAGALVSWNIQYRNKDFFILLLLLATGVLGVFATVDLFFFFFFYELAVLPMYLLIGVWGSSSDFGTFVRTKEYGAMKLTIYLSAGSVLVWVALIAIYVQAGLSTFDLLKLEDVTFDPSFQKLFFPFLMVGFGVLAGLWPFHTWSPDGHVAAPTAVSMLHAGVLMKLGAYGILRVGMELLPEGTAFWAPLLIGLGTVNVIYGAISAMGQRDLKYVVGYSSVSHMGYVLMGLGTIDRFGLDGAVLQMFSHGIMTALF
ncbi:MAG: NADH-quinone oxidoreductase subunit M, partial [Chloroflexi bacterium]|nr:NADH-quinone oxidoreductase subunit M [Chloroflexota bacterium]